MLIDKLNNLGKKIETKFPEINSGGCGVFAVMVTKELKKHAVYPRVIIATHDRRDIKEVVKNIKDIADEKEWIRNGISFCHLGVEFIYKGAKYHYDSSGVHLASEHLVRWRVCKGTLRLSWAEKMADNPKNWNTMFNRGDMPAIEKIVKKMLDPAIKPKKKLPNLLSNLLSITD